jgi:hypothetical protein
MAAPADTKGKLIILEPDDSLDEEAKLLLKQAEHCYDKIVTEMLSHKEVKDTDYSVCQKLIRIVYPVITAI